MKRDTQDLQIPSPQHDPDASSEVRIFAAWMGLVLVAFGVAMAGYLFFRIGQVILDPRTFETQVDRWEFVIRGRTTDAFPEVYETPERRIISPQSAQNAGSGNETAAVGSGQKESRAEEIAQFVGRVGSKSARPAALLIITLVLAILVRIILGIINAGIRLAGLAGGEREYMKRILDELVNRRNHPRE